MNTKTFTAPIQFKAQGEADTETGEFEATFATLRVKDHHGDVTLPGAFTNGQAVIVEGWNHDYSIPAGAGVIHADEERAWVEGRFFLDTQAGRENYRTVKNLGNAEWSYTFDILQGEPGEWNGEQVRLLKVSRRGGGVPCHERSRYQHRHSSGKIKNKRRRRGH
jgi:hypothetical protein